jgi:hypothetical protein
MNISFTTPLRYTPRDKQDMLVVCGQAMDSKRSSFYVISVPIGRFLSLGIYISGTEAHAYAGTGDGLGIE